MLLNIEAYFPHAQEEAVLEALQELPQALRPMYFTDSEELGKVKQRIGDFSGFSKFRAENSYGYFLHSQLLRYNLVKLATKAHCKLEIDPYRNETSESDVVLVLETLVKAEASFAFACAPEEYRHRNQYSRKLGMNHFEAWLGRDLDRYLPGIYWMTIFSQQYASAAPSHTSQLSEGLTLKQVGTHHTLVRCFDNPSDWRQFAKKLDDWCTENKAFFSKQRIISQLDTAPSVSVLAEIAARWR